jgi:hypothetical protein
MVPMRASESFVGRQQRHLERLSQRHVGGVVCRQRRAQLPDPLEHWACRIARERELGKITERNEAPCFVDPSFGDDAPQSRCDLEIDDVGGMQRLGPVELLFDCPGCGRGQEEVDERGRVNDQQADGREPLVPLE